MSRNVCLSISLLSYKLFNSTHTLHYVGQVVHFGSGLQNYITLQDSACL